VSDGYVRMLSSRYRWLDPARFTVIPFGAAKHDFDFVDARGISQPIFKPGAGVIRWVYAGRGGPDMDPVVEAFFEQLARLKTVDPDFVARLRVHFVGTNYSPLPRSFKVVEPLAAQYGVADLIEEYPGRIPYHQTLALYNESDAVLLFGSSLAEYTPSKLFNCVMSKRPVLALLRGGSPGDAVIRGFRNAFVASFRLSPSEPEFAASIAEGLRWLREPNHEMPAVDDQISSWTAKELTRAQCSVFDGLYK
jgi:hypothetical protein